MSVKSMLRIEFLLRELADGRFHSGENLAGKLGVSRTAVWKLIQKIESWQVEIYSVRGKGYQIPGGLDLLDQVFLSEQLASNRHFTQVDVLTSIDSTADYLALQWKANPGIGRVCIAEHQSAGRGRKGRAWISPYGANLYFSIGVELPIGLSALGGLSLAIGMSLAKTLNTMTTEPIKIKWPNDLLINNKKLAGILVEASGDSNDNSFLNIGIGLNWKMQDKQGQSIDQPWANLQQLMRKPLTRNQVLATVLVDLDNAISDYQRSGFAHFSRHWRQLSAMIDQPVSILMSQKSLEGTEIGVENNGALRLQTPQGIQIIHSGEVSLRKK